MLEAGVQRSIWLALGRVCTLFRVNTGKAWVKGSGKVTRLRDGTVLVPNGRPIALGFGLSNGDPLEGASDLCGWTSIEITPEMVGRKVAVFTAIETKESGGGHKRDAQKHFIKQVRSAGGIAGFAKSVDESEAIVRDYLDRRSD